MSNCTRNFEMRVIQEVGTINWDYDNIKNELEKIVENYKGLIYTEETIKTAKKNRAELNKLKKEIQLKQKQCKETCLSPYKGLEPSIKELINIVEKQKEEIDNCVKAFEEKIKERKRSDIKKYYNMEAEILGELAEKLYSKIYDLKWENATVGAKKYQEEIVIAINNIRKDLKEVEELKSIFQKELVEVYCENLSLTDVLKKNRELMDIVDKVNILSKDAEEVSVEVPIWKKVEKERNSLGELKIKIKAKPNQIEQILDFMNLIGVEYEEI